MGPAAVVATSDGGAVVLTSALQRAAALTRVGPDGEVIWDRLFGTAEAGFGVHDAVEQPDGGFIAVGRLRTYSTNDRDAFLIRVSDKGDIVWQKTIGGDAEDGMSSLVRIGANELAAVGGTASAGAGDPDTWVVIFTPDGVVTRELVVGKPGQADGPLDSERAYAATAGGDVLFASHTFLRVLVGRLGTASSTCSTTRAVSMRVRDARSAHREARLETTTFTPGIHEVSVSLVREAKGTTTALCRWSGAAAPPKPQPIVMAGPSEEELFAEEAANLLIAREFDELDSLAAGLRARRARFDSGASRLRAFYEALGRHSTLTSLPDDAHRHLLAEWEAATSSATSRIARASHDYAVAQRVRGSGFVSSILPADAERHAELVDAILTSLRRVEADGACDAACFDLQVRAGTMGGWSGPLEKLLATDPGYWEVFAPAALYLSPLWGGSTDAMARFADEAARRTRSTLGDALYALHYAGWTFGGIYGDPTDRPPDPDWPRMRKGFTDFLRLHPRSRRGAHRFAAAAYRVARDRPAARSLFRSPLLEWHPGLLVWENRAEYDRARAWAFAKPASPFAAALASGRLPAQRIVAPAVIHFADGTTAKVRAFVAATAKGPVGVTVRARTWAELEHQPVRWHVDAAEIVPRAPRRIDGRWLTFPPSKKLAAQLYPLPVATVSAETGDRLFILGDGEVIPVRSLGSGMFEPPRDRPFSPQELAGAPVLDDTGAVAGMLLPPATPGAAVQMIDVDVIVPP